MSSKDSVVVSSPVRFWTTRSLMITNVGSKFKNKEVVSTKFFCRRDPNLVTFTMDVKFGKEKEGFASVFVGPKGTTKSITMTMHKFILRNEEGSNLSSMEYTHPRVCIGQSCWGWAEFYKSDETKDVTWRVICEVEYEAPSPAIAPSDSCITSLQVDLLNMLKSPNNADITFIVGGERIKAHKDILAARCTYFANMFRSGMKESVADEVEIKEEEPAVFQGLLEFLYSGSAPKNLAEIAINLISLADKYDLEDLKKICEVHVCAQLNAENCVNALVAAKRHNCPDLLSHAKSSFPAYVEALTKAEESFRQLRENPDVLADLLVHLCIQ